jgi:twinkle protein
MQEFLNYGIIPKTNADNQKLKCPKCSNSRKNKTDKPLSISLSKGVFNCHNCGWSGNVKFKKKKEFVKPIQVKSKLSDEVLNWFKKRCISENTLSNWKISESIEFMPQVGKKRKTIHFNYFRDNQLINVKYRDGDKNFRMVSGAELIFYGLDRIKELNKIYIVEGEIDALSVFEAGIYSVCSVPNGASKGNQRLEYLDNCWKYFEEKTEIIICTDNDAPGLALKNELARRFGTYRCKYVDFGDFKDANDVLVSQGKEALKDYLLNPKSFPITGVLNINDIWDDVLNYNENGVINYSIGFNTQVDDLFKVAFGEWSIITGIPNSGKSDFVDQLCCNLALKYDFRIAMFSPESFPYEGHIKRIANKLNEKKVNNDILNASKTFIEEHFYFVKIDLEELTLKSILDRFRDLVFQKGINICVIDPWNMLDHSAQKDHSYIGRILSEITQFCQKQNVHLFLVAHPRKIESVNGQYRVPTPYDISGSADFFNKAYNCLTVFRELGQQTEYKSDAVSVHIQKVKRKENGSQGKFYIAPDFYNGGVYRFIQENEKKTVALGNVPF